MSRAKTSLRQSLKNLLTDQSTRIKAVNTRLKFANDFSIVIQALIEAHPKNEYTGKKSESAKKLKEKNFIFQIKRATDIPPFLLFYSKYYKIFEEHGMSDSQIQENKKARKTLGRNKSDQVLDRHNIKRKFASVLLMPITYGYLLLEEDFRKIEKTSRFKDKHVDSFLSTYQNFPKSLNFTLECLDAYLKENNQKIEGLNLIKIVRALDKIANSLPNLDDKELNKETLKQSVVELFEENIHDVGSHLHMDIGQRFDAGNFSIEKLRTRFQKKNFLEGINKPNPEIQHLQEIEGISDEQKR